MYLWDKKKQVSLYIDHLKYLILSSPDQSFEVQNSRRLNIWQWSWGTFLVAITIAVFLHSILLHQALRRKDGENIKRAVHLVLILSRNIIIKLYIYLVTYVMFCSNFISCGVVLLACSNWWTLFYLSNYPLEVCSLISATLFWCYVQGKL